MSFSRQSGSLLPSLPHPCEGCSRRPLQWIIGLVNVHLTCTISMTSPQRSSLCCQRTGRRVDHCPRWQALPSRWLACVPESPRHESKCHCSNLHHWPAQRHKIQQPPSQTGLIIFIVQEKGFLLDKKGCWCALAVALETKGRESSSKGKPGQGSGNGNTQSGHQHGGQHGAEGRPRSQRLLA